MLGCATNQDSTARDFTVLIIPHNDPVMIVSSIAGSFEETMK